MREYGRIHSAFWSSADVQSLSDDGRILAAYLLTCSHGTIAGVCRLPDGYAAEDLKWAAERVSKGFAELFEKGFANRCETTKWVWVRKFLQWNAPENPNQWKAVWKVVGQIPTQCAWRVDFMRVLTALTGKEPPPEANPCETVAEPFRNLIPSQPTPTATATQQEGKSTRAPRSPATPNAELKQKRGSRIPTPFLLTSEMRAWVKSETPDVDVEFETKEFADYWRTVPGQKGCKLDWVLTWQVRLREIQRRCRPARWANGHTEEPKLTWRPPADEEEANASR